MAKRYRNTKARRREIKNFEKLWRTTQNKVYYRRKTQNFDFKPFLPIQSKRDLKNLSTKEIQKINKQLSNINSKNSKFFQKKSYKNGTFPIILEEQIRNLESEIFKRQQEIDKRDSERPIIIGRNEVSNDTVLSQRLMGKPNLTLSSNIKPYDFDKPSDIKSLQSALEVRQNRLDPQWHLERQEIMKENYINSLIDLYNDEADTAIDKLRNIPADDFYDLYQQFEVIDFVYVPSGGQKAGDDEYESLRLLEEILDDYNEGKIDNRAKIFE